MTITRHLGNWTGLTLSLAVLASCASTNTPTPSPAEKAADEARQAQKAEQELLDSTKDFILSALPAQELAPGECGLFLFAQKPTARFVFFGQTAQQKALIRHYGNMVDLKLVSAGGDIFDQTYTEQVFEAEGEGLRIEISLDSYIQEQSGSRVPGGSLRLTDTEGWTTVIPVAGATACKDRIG